MPENSKIDQWCSTKMKVISCTYAWKIQNFRFLPHANKESLHSTVFASNDPLNMNWCIKVSPRGSDEDSKNYVSVFLQLVNGRGLKDIRATFKFCILDQHKKQRRVMESKRPYKFLEGCDWGFKKYIGHEMLMNKANGLLVDDYLTIFCEVRVLSTAVTHDSPFKMVETKAPESTLIQDLENSFNMEKHTDVVFKFASKQLQAHRSILAVRSPVFNAMFTHPMEEQRHGIVHISDISCEVFQQMMYYIYTDQEPKNIDSLAAELLIAADKYDLPHLKTMCENSISNNLNVENAANCLVLGDMHNAKSLRQKALKFIQCNAVEVAETNGYKSLLKDHSHLVTDTLRAIAVSRKQNEQSNMPRKKMKVV